MSIFAWVVLGLIIGLVASKIMNEDSEGRMMDIALGVVGALLGGWLFAQFGPKGQPGMDWWSVPAAAGGAVIVLMGYHTIAVKDARGL